MMVLAQTLFNIPVEELNLDQVELLLGYYEGYLSYEKFQELDQRRDELLNA